MHGAERAHGGVLVHYRAGVERHQVLAYYWVDELGRAQAGTEVDGVGHARRGMGHTGPRGRGDAYSGGQAQPGQGPDEHGRGPGAGHRDDRAQAGPRPCAHHGQVGDRFGGIARKQAGGGGELRLPGRARPSQPDQAVHQVGAVAGHVCDAGGGHGGGAVAPVARDGVETDERETGGHGLQGREAAGVLHQDVAGRHDPGHVVGPAEHGSPVTLGLGQVFKVTAQGVVAPAHHHGHEPGPGGHQLEGLAYRPDAPRARGDKDRQVPLAQAELGPLRRPSRPGRGELGAHERSARQAGLTRVPGHVGHRTGVDGQVEVDAGVCPEGVVAEVGYEIDGRDAQPGAPVPGPAVLRPAAHVAQDLGGDREG